MICIQSFHDISTGEVDAISLEGGSLRLSCARAGRTKQHDSEMTAIGAGQGRRDGCRRCAAKAFHTQITSTISHLVRVRGSMALLVSLRTQPNIGSMCREVVVSRLSNKQQGRLAPNNQEQQRWLRRGAEATIGMCWMLKPSNVRRTLPCRPSPSSTSTVHAQWLALWLLQPAQNDTCCPDSDLILTGPSRSG
jgi:hypothetical protein